MGPSVDGRWSRVSQYIEQRVKAVGVPGVAVAILSHGEQHVGAFGVTNADHPLPVTEATLFQIGSVTKTFTGTAIMRLVEQGRIDLDARVRQYLPDFRVADPDVSACVAVRHLLTHMEGWDGDVFVDTGEGDDALARSIDALAVCEQLAPLGTVWSYNNSGFAIAGRILEVVSGQSYESLMEELLLGPLGMRHTVLDRMKVMTQRFVCGHTVAPGGPIVLQPWGIPRYANSGGGIIADIGDMARYAAFHLGDGCAADGVRLLTAQSLDRLHSPQVRISDTNGWGITFETSEAHGIRQFLHSGTTIGQTSFMIAVPEQRFAMVILTNAHEGGLVIREAVQRAVKEFLEIDMRDPSPIPTTEADCRPYVGRYERRTGFVDVGLLGGRLIAQSVPTTGFPTADSPVPPPPPPMVLELVGADQLRVLQGQSVAGEAQFVRQADGRVGWLRLGGRIHKRMDQ